MEDVDKVDEGVQCTGCGRWTWSDQYGKEHWRVVPGTTEYDKCGEYQ